MTMNVSWKINMLLEIKTCEDFIEFIGLSICVIYRCKLKYTNYHGVKLYYVISLEIHPKIDMYRFEAYTGRQKKLNELFPASQTVGHL